MKADTQFAIAQMKEEQGTGFVNSSNNFGAKKLDVKPQITEEISQSKVLEAARRVTGRSTAAAVVPSKAPEQPSGKKDLKNV